MTTLAQSLSAHYFPRLSGRLRDLFLVIGASLLVALCARIEIPLPFTPVPITGQTFAVLLVGAALGSRRGAAAMLLYLAEGAAGLPVFAGGGSGPGLLSGVTAGYLAGFVAAAYVVGWLAERGLERNLRTSFIPFLTGTIIIYAFGAAWLSVLLGGIGKAVAAGVIPFLAGDLIKLVGAAVALPAAWKLVR
jgi:biotin transport system substrate-specific component